MSVPEALGWAKSVLDMFGITPFIPALMIVLIAFFVINRFFGRGE